MKGSETYKKEDQHRDILLAQQDENLLNEFCIKNQELIWTAIDKLFYSRRLAIMYCENNNLEIYDLFQEGFIGLIKSVRDFDVSFGCKFSTYAVPTIEGSIRRFKRDFNCQIKLPRSCKDIIYRFNNIKRQNPLLSFDEIFEKILKETEFNEEQIKLSRDYMSIRFFSIDEEIGWNNSEREDKGILFSEKIEDESNIYSAEDAVYNILKDQICEDLKNFTNLKEKVFLKLLLDEQINLISQTEISKILKISQAQVSRLTIQVKNFIEIYLYFQNLSEGDVNLMAKQSKLIKHVDFFREYCLAYRQIPKSNEFNKMLLQRQLDPLSNANFYYIRSKIIKQLKAEGRDDLANELEKGSSTKGFKLKEETPKEKNQIKELVKEISNAKSIQVDTEEDHLITIKNSIKCKKECSDVEELKSIFQSIHNLIKMESMGKFVVKVEVNKVV